MGIKLIYLLQGTAAVLVLLPAQKCYEKCSPFPYSCHARQSFLIMYLFSYVLHRKQPGKASVNINNKNNEAFRDEGLPSMF